MARQTVRRSHARRRHETRHRLHKPKWRDPFPHIPGTEPEKRIFAALVARRIFFIFQGQIPELTKGLFVTLAIPGYKPDIIIPEFKVIIDPFSEFHHTLPGAVERDIRKIALYTAFGYAYYHPWASEVNERGGNRIIEEIPELWGKKKAELTPKQKKLAQFPGFELGPFLGAGAESVAAANRRRWKPPLRTISRGQRRGRRVRHLP